MKSVQYTVDFVMFIFTPSRNVCASFLVLVDICHMHDYLRCCYAVERWVKYETTGSEGRNGEA